MTESTPPTQRLVFSFANLLYAVTGNAFITPSTEGELYPALNVIKTGSPWSPWQTTALGDQWLEMRFGIAQSPRLFFLPRTNFTEARLQADDNADWDDPDVDIAITIEQNNYNYRYQYGALMPTSLGAYENWRLFIPDQDVTDGSGVYRVGGVWFADDVIYAPTHFEYAIQRETLRPGIVGDLASGGSRVTTTGNPAAKLTAKRIPRTKRITPGLDDALAEWSVINRKIWEAGRRFVVMLSQTDTTETYVVDDVGTQVLDRTSPIRAASTITMVDSVGP